MTNREFYKSIGICPNCRKRPITGKENSCSECRKIRADNARKRREENRELVNRIQREQTRLRKSKRRENGECLRCGRKLTDTNYSRCEVCRKKIRDYLIRKKEVIYGKS